jgi:hypothetical protein
VPRALTFEQARLELNRLRRQVLEYKSADPEAAHSLKESALLAALDTILRSTLSDTEVRKLAAKALLIHKIKTRW